LGTTRDDYRHGGRPAEDFVKIPMSGGTIARGEFPGHVGGVLRLHVEWTITVERK
jgi:hypothetical protein